MQQFDETVAFIEQLNRAESAQDICMKLLDFTGQFGLDRLMAGTAPSKDENARQQREHVLMCGWPVEWLNKYVAGNYAQIDPVIGHMKETLNPFCWDEAERTAASVTDARRFMGEAKEFGLVSGLAIPLVTVDGSMALVSLGGEAPDIPPHAQGMISLVSTYAIARAMQISSKTAKHGSLRLTRREAECIRWAAEGKSEWEISQILGISEHTSEKHLISAKVKLGAVNRVHAVAEAIRQGYIV